VAERSVNGYKAPEGVNLSPREVEKYLALLKKYEFPASRGQFLKELWQSNPDSWLIDGAKALLDVAIAGNEYIQYLQSEVRHGRDVPKGDGSKLIIIPGFGAAGFHYRPTVRTFRNIGYDAEVYPLKYGFNIEPMEDMVDDFVDYIKSENQKNGKKVNIIGHSKGGLLGAVTYATHQEEFEENVNHLVLVGSPNPRRVNNLVGATYLGILLATGRDDFRYTAELNKIIGLAHKPEIKFTQIGAYNDPIIAGDHIGSRKDSILVHGSHSGLMINPVVLKDIAERLWTFSETYQPFKILEAA